MNIRLSAMIYCCVLGTVITLPACKIDRLLGKKSPHETYSDQLRSSGLNNTALGTKWFSEATRGLEMPIGIKLPFKENGYFPADNPLAAGYTFRLPQGQKVKITVSLRTVDGGRIFAELWDARGSGSKPSLLKYSDSSGTINLEADEDMNLTLRLQPELLITVSYSLTIIVEPSLAFPVSGAKNGDIGSTWGDQRDGGARRHEGIDIFAKRGTPALAGASGRITSVKEGGLGGKTVWLRPDGRNISLYYAHLDSQSVSMGQRVMEGDTIGLVGNTGNARTTSPHLHFGIYSVGGAIDPLPYVKKELPGPPAIKGNETFIGKSVRTSSKQSLFRSAASKVDAMELSANTYVTILATTGDYYKILLPDKTEGLLLTNTVAPADRTLESIKISEQVELTADPLPGSAVTAYVEATSLPVKAYYKDHLFIETDSLRGWLVRSAIPSGK